MTQPRPPVPNLKPTPLRGRLSRLFGSAENPPASPPLDLDNVSALIAYSAESGISPAKAADLHALLQKYRAEGTPDLEPQILKAYAELIQDTKPVTGQTLRDTDNASWFFGRLYVVLGVLLLLAVGNTILSGWLSEQLEPDDPSALSLFTLQRHILNPIEPLVWGALGAAVYVAKVIYDVASNQQFSRAKLKGWQLRLILGAVLAVAVLSIFSPESLSGNGVPLTASAVAFLVGLGVKVVYGAFEKTIDALAQRMNLAALRREPSKLNDIRQYLTAKVDSTPDANAERKRILRDVLSEADREAQS